MAPDAERDEDLMWLVAQDRADRLAPLVRRHATGLLTFLTRMLGDSHRAEELFQEVFLAVWVKRGQYQYPQIPGGNISPAAPSDFDLELRQRLAPRLPPGSAISRAFRGPRSSAVAFFTERVPPPRSLREAIWHPFLGFLARHRALEILAFVICYKLADNLAQSLTRPFLHDMGYSDFDRDHALPNLSYVIVSVVSGEIADTLSWRLRDDRSAMDPESVDVVDHVVAESPS